MDVYKITGENRLKGTIKVSGAKNSAVALIPASILANSPVTIGGITRNFRCVDVKSTT